MVLAARGGPATHGAGVVSEAPPVDRSDLLARMNAIMEKAKAQPTPEPTPPVERPQRREVRTTRTERTFGGPPGPSPSEGGCGHSGMMTFDEERCSCGSCGATWKLDSYHGKLQWVVVRRAR
jgi:hypothetical protein